MASKTVTQGRALEGTINISACIASVKGGSSPAEAAATEEAYGQTVRIGLECGGYQPLLPGTEMELLQQIKDFLIPELDSIRQEQSAVRERLNSIDMHLVDQSRRIDETNKRIDETNKRIDKLQADLIGRIDETNKRTDRVHDDLLARIDETNKRIDMVQADFNRRLDRLFEVIVRRDEHVGLENWVRELDRRLDALERRAA